MANFWTDAALEPKRGYRFKVEIGGVGTTKASYFIKSVSKPGVKISAKEHIYLGHKFHYPGLVTWEPNPISIKLIDPVSPDASQHLSAIFQAAGYMVPGDPNQVTTPSKSGAVTALGDVTIMQIDESHGAAGATGGNVIEKWTLMNPFIESIKFGDLDYSKEDLTEIEVQIRYDWAVLETANGIENPNLQNQLNSVLPVVGNDPNKRFG